MDIGSKDEREYTFTNVLNLGNSMNKQYLKKVGSELQEYLLFRRRGKKVDAKNEKVINIAVLKKNAEQDNK